MLVCFVEKLKISIFFMKKILIFNIKPDIRYPARLLAGYPAKSVSGSTLERIDYLISAEKRATPCVR